MHKRRRRKMWTIGLGSLLVLLLVAGWCLVRYTRRGQGTYSVLEHRLETWWGYSAPDRSRTGSVSGTVYDVRGAPLPEAVVVVSTRDGQTIHVRTDSAGHYRLENVPAGRVVPAATGHGYRDQVYRRARWLANSAVRVREGEDTPGVDFTLSSETAPAVLPADIERGASVLISDDYPVPTTARRTRVAFERDGYTVSGYVYEPTDDDVQGRLPAILAAYPGYPLNWEPASVAFVAQGYVVLAIAPVSMRDLDVDADADDLAVALALLHQGRLSERVDSERIGALGGSFSSMALMRALRRVPRVRAVVLMGSLTDVYLLRYDAYYSGYEGYKLSPLFEWAMWSMGRPDRMPRMYVRNSVVFHTRGLPPLCIIHGTKDEVIPYNQSQRLADVLREESYAGEWELHIYSGTGHYPGIYDPDPATEAMYREMVRFLAEKLSVESPGE